MKIKCIAKKWQYLSEKVIEATGYSGASFYELHIGEEYIVYGMELRRGVLHYLIDSAFWYPSDFFKLPAHYSTMNGTLPYAKTEMI